VGDVIFIIANRVVSVSTHADEAEKGLGCRV